MGEVVQLHQLHQSVATCPQCKGQLWFIHVNGFHDDYDKVTGHECGDCGWKLNIEVAVEK